MENIKGILITMLVPMDNHIANAGEKLLKNVSSIKKRPDDRVYISGQMQRHALFSAMSRINCTDSNRGSTYVSNGDGIDNSLERNLRADLGGFMHPSGSNYTGRRTAPLSATPAVAISESDIGRDLLLRLKSMDRDNSIASREFSQHDDMLMNFFLDIGSVSISKRYTYDKGGFHLNTEFIKHVPEKERKRRVKLFFEATQSITDYANQARNAVCGEPQKVLIVLDCKLSRKGCRYFQANEAEKNNLLVEIIDRGGIYIMGDDTVVPNESVGSVNQAFKKAISIILDEATTLYDPAGGDDNILSFVDTFGSDLNNEDIATETE